MYLALRPPAAVCRLPYCLRYVKDRINAVSLVVVTHNEDRPSRLVLATGRGVYPPVRARQKAPAAIAERLLLKWVKLRLFHLRPRPRRAGLACRTFPSSGRHRTANILAGCPSIAR